ncbi:MAG TPA: tetratricopeptide repeat protein [Gemmatimonadaceae bacterium]
MTRWRSAASVVLLAAGGCLASKSDIRLLQDELRVTRAQVAAGDTAVLRAEEARRQQIAALSATIDRMNDSLRAQAARFAAFQANASGEFDAMGRQMVQVQALLGQNTRTVQETRAQLQALREGATSAPPSPTSPDTSQRGGAGVPGPATLFTAGMDALRQGSYRTARSNFDQLLTSYPTSDQASLAQLRVGDAYKSEGNTTAADSVYNVVATKYPKSPEAPTALYSRGRLLWEANKRGEARVVLNRLIRDYPNADEVDLAKNLLKQP